ncbi:MAG TPA: hypothetical protein VFU14_06245 [Acidimicrobiales bacterium]|nr:hypothetical protein [Acidimicrobiales bacterium]
MAVNDDRPLDADRLAPAAHGAGSAPADEPEGAVDRTVTTVLEGVDRVAEKIKALLGSNR